MTSSSLEQFKERRCLWLKCFGGENPDDTNSIFRQICRMVQNAGVFQTLIECHRMAPPTEGAEEGSVQVNGLIYNLIDRWFFESQAMAIRRLTDGYSLKSISKEEDVFSLVSLLEDMKKHANLMTRENIFEAEGREYDYKLIKRKDDEYCTKGGAVPKESIWIFHEERHKQIDSLAGVCEDSRSPQDCVRRELLERMERKVREACKDIKTYVNKFVAHPATPESRKKVDADKAVVTFKHFCEAHKALCQVASFLASYILGQGQWATFLPTLQEKNQFIYIDRPLVTSEDVAKLGKVWEDYEKETQGWNERGIDDLLQEYGQTQAPKDGVDG